jgi:hypothetical protein
LNVIAIALIVLMIVVIPAIVAVAVADKMVKRVTTAKTTMTLADATAAFAHPQVRTDNAIPTNAVLLYGGRDPKSSCIITGIQTSGNDQQDRV